MYRLCVCVRMQGKLPLCDFLHCPLYSQLVHLLLLLLLLLSGIYEFEPPASGGSEITHKDTPQSVGLLWTSDQPVAETST